MAFDPAKYQQFKSKIPSPKTGVEKAQDVAKEKSVGLLKGTLDVLNTFAYGVGGVISGVSPVEGIKRKILPSQALGITNAVGSFATDVLLDPTTYITLGTSGGAKIATKAGTEVVLNKVGTTALRETIQRVGAQEGKKQFAELIAKNPQWLDKSGLKFMGQTVIPQSAVEASFKSISKPIVSVTKKIPGVEKIATGIKEFGQEVFDPMVKIRKLPKGEEFLKRFSLLTKSTRSEIVDATEIVAKKYAEGVAKFGKTFGDDVTEYIEKGIAKNPEIAKIGQDIIKIQDVMANAEEARGLLKSTLGQTIGKVSPKIRPIIEKYSDDILSGIIKTSDEFKSLLSKSEKSLLKGSNTPSKLFEKIITTKPNVENYLRHYITKEGRDYIKKGGDFYGALPKPLRAKLQSGNMRTIRASISDINKSMQEKIGGNFFESNAFKALAGRQAESIKAINIFDFIDGVKRDYGIQAIKGEKERFIEGVKYIPSTNPQLSGMLLPEPIAKHIDDTVKFINGDEATNNFLRGYDRLLRFWKGSVTGYFPAFHTRNMIGGSFNNWLGKVSSKSYAISEDILDFTPKSSKEKALEPIVQEAKKYKSAEEFIKAQKKDYGMSHRPTETGATADNISQNKSDMGFPKDFYQHPEYYENMSDKSVKESFNVLRKIKDNPEAEITIYRASPKNEFNRGDWVSLSKNYAKGESLSENTPVHSLKVKAKDVQFAGDSINEFGYYPTGKTIKESQLTDIWNQAQEIKNTLENKIYTSKTGETFTGKQLLDGARKHGAIGQPGMIDVMGEVEKDIGKSKLAKLGDYPVKTMEFVENRIRFPMFVDRVINRGWSMEDAAKDVFKYHFDYAPEGLSAFERNWLKRLFPFYTWTRNNIPLQIEQLMKQPGKYAALGKLQDTIGGEKGREEMKDLPDWMKQQLNFRIGGDNGMSMWIQLPLPVEDLAKLPTSETGIRDIVSMLSPVIKTPIELVTNKNLFFGSDIVNPELKDYPELQTAKTMESLKLLPEPIKKFINFKIIKKKVYEGGKPVWKEQAEMDAKKLYLLKSAFGRFYSTIEQIGGDKEGIAAKISRVLGGVPVREVDIEQQKYWDTYNKEQGEKAKNSYEKSRIPVE
jgi:hypothetical protein